MTAKLALRYEFSSYPNDDFGWLAASVETDAFTGRGGFWVQWQDVEEWSAKLDAYPFLTDDPCAVDWGQGNSEGSNYEVILGISILPIDKTGNLDVTVRIADHQDTRRQCQTVFRTSYSDTDRFAVEMQSLMRRERTEAVLLGRNVG